jgi:phospholipase C
MVRRVLVLTLLILVALAMLPVGGAAASGAGSDRLSRINHIVVIYQENHSFDNLYGRWEGVNGLRHAPRARTIQVNQAGVAYQCLLRGRQRAICLLRRRQAMVTP